MQEVILNQNVTMGVEALRKLVSDDVAAVDALIRTRLHSDVTLINQLRTTSSTVAASDCAPCWCCSPPAPAATGRQHINLAAVVEFIHTATLLHDDVVDASDCAAGHETANAIWGNEASVLVGDFLYSRAFEMMVEAGRHGVMEIMSACHQHYRRGRSAATAQLP